MTNQELIHKFYTSFSNGNIKEMIECYHEDITFQDPVFGRLEGERAMKMWEMLLSIKNQDTTVTFDNIQSNSDNGKVNWVANYSYGKTKRKVTNKVSAQFKFKDGKIIEHIDSFDLWKWTKQAMGIAGYLIGWTPFLKSKIQATTNKRLDNYIKKTSPENI
jgi:ketosteroid isomerase-like protein